MALNQKNEKLVTIGLNDISTFTRLIERYFKDRYYMITGATGCGKSTIIPWIYFSTLKKGQSVLFVVPAAAHIGNIAYENQVLIPRIMASNVQLRPYAKAPKPTRGILSGKVFDGVRLCTADDLIKAIVANKFTSIPHFAIILDEQHLPLNSVVMLKTWLRSSAYDGRYFQISATPDGSASATAPTRGVTFRNIAASIEDYEAQSKIWNSSPLNPLTYLSSVSYDNFVVAALLPTRRLLLTVRDRLSELVDNVWCVTENSSSIEYERMVRAVSTGRHIVLVSDKVSAGITFRMNVLIDCRYTYTTVLENGVLVEKYTPVDAAAAAQRAGRAGRVIKTMVYVNDHLSDERVDEASAYLEANAIIFCVAMGAKINEFIGTSGYKMYSRLRSLTMACAQRAMTDSNLSPLLGIYKYDNAGDMFAACGGTAPGFSDLCKHDLKLFVSNGTLDKPIKRTFVAPIFDAVSRSFDPYEFLPIDQQGEVIDAVVEVESARLNSLSTERKISYITEKFSEYVDFVFTAIKGICQPYGARPKLYSSHSVRANTIEGRRRMCTYDGSDLEMFITKLIGLKGVTYVEKDLKVVPGTQPVIDPVATKTRDAEAAARHRNGMAGLQAMVKISSDNKARAERDLARHLAFADVTKTITDWSATDIDDAVDIIQKLEVAVRDWITAVNQTSGQIDLTVHVPTSIMANTSPVFAAMFPSGSIDYTDASTVHSLVSDLQAYSVSQEAIATLVDTYTDAVTEATVDLEAAEDALNAYGVFVKDPNPVMTPPGTDQYQWFPMLTFDDGTTSHETSLRLAERYKYTDALGDEYVDAKMGSKDLFKMLDSRISAAAMREVAPDRYVDLVDFRNLVPSDHEWYWKNNH